MTEDNSIRKKPFSPWHFIWIAVVFSELFTAFITSIQHYFSPETDLRDMLTVGAIDALFVPLIVAPIIIYFMKSTSGLRKLNRELEKEILERRHAEELLRRNEDQLRLAMNVSKQSEDKIKRHAENMTALLDASRLLTSTLDIEVTLQNITEIAAGILRLDTVAIYLLEGGTLYLGATTPPLPKEFPNSYRYAQLIDHPHIRQALESGQPVIIPDTASEKLTSAERGICEVRGLSSILYVPLMVKEQAIGVLIPALCGKPGAFSQDDIEICRTLSHQVALAIINAQLHRNALQYAGELEERIVERKAAEEALKESKEQLRTVVEKSPFAMALVSMKGDIEYINLKAIETFGYLHQDIPTMDTWWEQAYPDKTYREQVITQWMGLLNEALLHKHEIEKREYRVTCKDGDVKIVSIFGVWVGDKVLAVFDDITERKRAEESLRKSEEQYRLLFTSIQDGIVMTNTERTIIAVNPAFTRLFGYAHGEIVGQKTTVLFARPKQFDDLGEDLKMHPSDSPFIYQIDYKKKNGMVFPGEAAISFFTDSGGNRIGFIGLIKDITDKKHAEKEKRLLEEERLKTQKLEAVGTLAGGIAHDFNNLLQGVFGYISLAKLRKDDREKSLAALDEAEKALHISVKLTNQLLTFSKGGNPVKKMIDPLIIIENAAKFALSGSRTNFRMKTDPQLWSIDADEGQISQVIQNIVLNADQALPDSGRIEITLRNVQTPGADLPPELVVGRYVEITITDSGIGISEQYLSKIFDPYFTTKEKGSGLGLATCYSIIKNHNGIINVKSEVGKGTSFRIFLPAIAGKVRAESAEKQQQPSQSRKAKILIMDDEEIIRNLSSELLGELGHEVEVAQDGQEALEKYKAAIAARKPFDAVILDLTIKGGMGGVETVRQLFKIDPYVKAIMSSGYSDDAATVNYLSQGFKASLKKPYHVDALKEVINKLLNS